MTRTVRHSPDSVIPKAGKSRRADHELKPLRTSALCVVAVLGTACGGAAQSIHPSTTTRPLNASSLQQVVTTGRLTFKLPSTWKVGYGTCRCGWGDPDTATLDNGPQGGGVACSCPMESSNASSGLHLYEGQTGLISGGRPTMIDGIQALVGLDTSNATLTATFPGVDQWITIGPAPSSRTVFGNEQQIALEKQILATVKVFPGSGGAS
jgi:hypothetical protein